jgi:hypothetical protein
VIVIDIEDTVTIRPADPHTPSVPLIPRRPDATGEQQVVIPATIGIVDTPAAADVVLAPFVRPAVPSPTYLDRMRYTGRRRQPGLIARMIGGAR